MLPHHLVTVNHQFLLVIGDRHHRGDKNKYYQVLNHTAIHSFWMICHYDRGRVRLVGTAPVGSSGQ